MRIPRVRTFARRVWEEETIRALRKVKEAVDKEAAEQAKEEKSSYATSLWGKITWRMKVSSELRKHKHPKGTKHKTVLKPDTHPWKFPNKT